MQFNKTTLAAVTAVALAGIGTGSALAASGSSAKASTTRDDQQAAIITALAGKLNITAADLKAALVAPAAAPHVPGAQSTQSELPLTFLKLPGTHRSHGPP